MSMSDESREMVSAAPACRQPTQGAQKAACMRLPWAPGKHHADSIKKKSVHVA